MSQYCQLFVIVQADEYCSRNGWLLGVVAGQSQLIGNFCQYYRDFQGHGVGMLGVDEGLGVEFGAKSCCL